MQLLFGLPFRIGSSIFTHLLKSYNTPHEAAKEFAGVVAFQCIPHSNHSTARGLLLWGEIVFEIVFETVFEITKLSNFVSIFHLWVCIACLLRDFSSSFLTSSYLIIMQYIRSGVIVAATPTIQFVLYNIRLPQRRPFPFTLG